MAKKFTKEVRANLNKMAKELGALGFSIDPVSELFVAGLWCFASLSTKQEAMASFGSPFFMKKHHRKSMLASVWILGALISQVLCARRGTGGVQSAVHRAAYWRAEAVSSVG